MALDLDGKPVRARAMKPLIISMGFNGYQWAYARNVRTQKVYASAHGYDYVFVEKPALTRLLMECAWLKIPLMLSALAAGRPWVLFVDCDIEVKHGTPAMETLFEEDKDLYMANGFSGRLNSGMILARNRPGVVSLLRTTLNDALKPIPPEDDVGWGENGHIIHYAKNYSGLKLLPTEWNNNQNPELADYFRHYSAGPMRQFYQFTPAERLAAKTGKLYVKTGKVYQTLTKLLGKEGQRDFFSQLRGLFATARHAYPVFASIDI